MNVSLVLTTCNRNDKVLSLLREVFECEPAPAEIIIVDSSNEVNQELSEMQGVHYIRTPHQNQPYQRLLGATAAKSEVVVFFDDDLKLINKRIFSTILQEYEQNEIVGVTVGIDYLSSIPEKMDKPVFNNKNMLLDWFAKFTGVIHPRPGRIGRLGLIGNYPTQKDTIEFFRGPCMSFLRNICDQIIPFDLIAQYEKKVGKGEDKIISMLAVQQGRLHYIPGIFLFHPPNESNYFQNIRTFTARVTYSRLYLSRIYAQVFHKSWWIEVLIYYWFTSWRVLIAFFSFLIKPTEARREKFLGTINGLCLALKLPQKAERLTPGINWEQEIQKDLKRAGIANTTNKNE